MTNFLAAGSKDFEFQQNPLWLHNFYIRKAMKA